MELYFFEDRIIAINIAIVMGPKFQKFIGFIIAYKI
jgi:hypothetical protein